MKTEKFLKFLKGEFEGWGRLERVVFPILLIIIVVISFYLNDSKIALVSAVCGISYTILAGKGKISCYITGLCGTMCYCFLAYKNGLYGNLALYMLYYFPMQVIGIFKWKKHLKKDTQEIEKTILRQHERIIYFLYTSAAWLVFALLLVKAGGKTPFADAFTVVFSVLGMLLTVKRCYEQWFVWLFVNAVSLYMWIVAYVNGSNCFATAYMWFIYLLLAVYFMFSWKRELDK